jgi:hypothetical protein
MISFIPSSEVIQEYGYAKQEINYSQKRTTSQSLLKTRVTGARKPYTK